MNGIRRSFTFRTVGLVLLGFIIGFSFSFSVDIKVSNSPGPVAHDSKPHKSDPDKIDFKTFKEVWKTLQKKHINHPFKDADLYNGAIQGMVRATQDPYTVYMSSKSFKELMDRMKGNYAGIGAYVETKNGLLTIVAPIEGSPAEEAGLLSGDAVLKVDGKDITELNLYEAVKLIRGKPGTKVKLTIYREGNKEPFEVEVVRAVVNVKSVSWEVKEKNIGYIKLKNFNSDTVELLNKAVKDLKKQKVKALIVDVRSNPGGFLSAAIGVCNKWISFNVVLFQKDSHDNETPHYSWGGSDFSDMPTVILINKFSASASEIFAGALQDYKLATLIGEKTFGKGSVQTFETYSDGSVLKFTFANWLTPKKRLIHGKGIEPDIEVKMDRKHVEKKQDPQLDKAFEFLKSKLNPKTEKDK